jgi:nitroreductase
MEKENNTLDSIYKRRSIRQFEDKPINDDLVLKVLDAANQAPSAHNQQTWRFIIIKDTKKKELADLVFQNADKFPRTSSALLRMASRTIHMAPVVIAIVNTGDLIEHGTKLFNIESPKAFDFFRTMEIQNSAAAVENLMLAAVSLGLGTVWLGVLFLIQQTVLEFLGEKGEFMAVVPLGYPQKVPNSPKKKPVEEIIRFL